MKKNTKVILGIVSGVVAVAVTTSAILFAGRKTPAPPVDTSDTSQTTSDVVVKPPVDEPTDTSKESNTGESSPDLVLDVNGNPQKTPDTSDKDKSDTPIKQPENPIEPKKPDLPVNNNNGGGIIIGGGDKPIEKYECGSPRHKCKNAGFHAGLLNRELEGCKYCQSHSCDSFYVLDQWGQPSYDQTKCPKYDAKKDSLHYCQDCGKKTGNGDNNTCQKWIIDFTCPSCGELVKANKCHTH